MDYIEIKFETRKVGFSGLMVKNQQLHAVYGDVAIPIKNGGLASVREHYADNDAYKAFGEADPSLNAFGLSLPPSMTVEDSTVVSVGGTVFVHRNIK